MEAAETLMISPRTHGPKAYGSAMPAPRRDWQNYGQEPSRYIRRASPEAIDRMVECWSWINTLPEQSDRQLLYAWAWTKARKGRFLNDLAGRQGRNPRTIRRAIIRICQGIADTLNKNEKPLRHASVDAVSDNRPVSASQTVSSDNRATYFRADDAKPRHDPSPEAARLVEKEIEKLNRRARKRLKTAAR
ncbi:MAG: DUF6362 family protein [Rhizobiaceae bacterium]|nr:DUF6362 family protein [Rhizobiaceae bacterium]MCV0408932.1 DUF6362 family protein [Rhizobiaceae bacterium]